MPPTVAVLHHLESPFTGHAGRALAAAGVALDERDLAGGDPLPDPGAVDGILSLGGEQSARELDRHPYLRAEVELLRSATERELPVFGVCLGGQLLARALGGEVRRMHRRMIGWEPLHPLAAARADDLFAALPAGASALHWNEDCFSLPPDAVELSAAAGPGCEAFRHGRCAWGIQFHPEVDAGVLETWYRLEGWLEQAGVEEAQARAADARHLPAQADVGAAIFGAFATVVRERLGALDRAPAEI